MNEQSNRRLFVVGVMVAIGLAVGVSQFASSEADGLEYVAQQEGFAETAQDHAVSGSPFAGYGEGVSDSGWVNTAVAGLLGTLLTLGLGSGVFWIARRTRGDGPLHGSG